MRFIVQRIPIPDEGFGVDYVMDRLSSPIKYSSDKSLAERYESFGEARSVVTSVLLGADGQLATAIEVVDEPMVVSSLNQASERVHELRTGLLFEGPFDGLPRYAEQHVLQALSYLDLAQRSLKLAWMEHLENR